MKDLFKSRGPFYDGWMLISNLIILNFLFVVFSLPIMTLGASLSSLYATAVNLSTDKFIMVTHEFLSNFKNFFNKGTKIFFTLSLSIFIIIGLIYFSILAKITFLIFLLLFIFSNLLLVTFITFPIGALYEGDYKLVLRNAAVFLHSNLIISIFIFFTTIVFYIIIPIFMPTFIILHLLIGFSGIAFFQIKIIKKVQYNKQ